MENNNRKNRNQNNTISHYRIKNFETPKKYAVNTKFVFDGVFEVVAKSKDEAREKVMKHCGLVIGGDIHSSLCSDEIDWSFNIHPTKVTGRIKQVK